MNKHEIRNIYGLWQLRRVSGNTSYQLKTFMDKEDAMQYAKQYKVRVIEGVMI